MGRLGLANFPYYLSSKMSDLVQARTYTRPPKLDFCLFLVVSCRVLSSSTIVCCNYTYALSCSCRPWGPIFLKHSCCIKFLRTSQTIRRLWNKLDIGLLPWMEATQKEHKLLLLNRGNDIGISLPIPVAVSCIYEYLAACEVALVLNM